MPAKPEVYETNGVVFAKTSGNAPTPDVGQREVVIDGQLQAIPNCISRKFINGGGFVVLIPIHTSRESKKENPFSPHSAYAGFIERTKFRRGWIDWRTGAHGTGRLFKYRLNRAEALQVATTEEQKAVINDWPPESEKSPALVVDEEPLAANWPAHRETLIELRKIRHQLEDAPYRDKANDMLDKELRHLTKGVSAGIAEGLAAAVDALTKQRLAQAQEAPAEPRRGR